MRRFLLPLDLQLFAGEKTEKATPKKRQDARKKGQVAKSMELTSAFILLCVLLMLSLYGTVVKSRVERLFTAAFYDYMGLELTYGNTASMLARFIFEGLVLMAPIFVVAVVIAVLSVYAQIGFLFTSETLKPTFSKLNPIKGIANIFKLRALVELLKSVLKAVIVGGVVFYAIWTERSELMAMTQWPISHIFSHTAEWVLKVGIEIAVILLVLAVFDYAYQRYEYEKSLRMSKEDIKQEFKNTEGDPVIKGRIRERQRKMALSRMMQEVPKADVVITNPTHFAVALKYDPEQADAPVVVAKGMDYLALKIKQVAQEHGIVTMENKPLARALYNQVEIGQTIPPELFQAVAEVLAYVYRLQGKTKVSK